MKYYLPLVMLLLTASCGDLPVYTSGTLTHFYDGFDGAIATNWSAQAYREECIQVVTNRARSGTGSVKFTIYPGDPEVASGARAELSYNNFDPYLGEVWYGWSFMLETNYVDSGSWQIMGQWHDQPDYQMGETWELFPANSPPVSIQYTNGILFMDVLYQDEDGLRFPSRPISKGVWHDLVVHFKWSVWKSGFAEAWLDGAPLVHTNTADQRIEAPTCYNTAGNYLKIGIYRSPGATATNTIYFDEVRIGESYEEVTPR